MKPRSSLSLFLWIALASSCDQSSDLSSLPSFHGRQYTVAPYLRAAIRFQSLGREEACKALLASKDDEQVFVMCRMLFMKRGASEFRRPMIGAAMFPAGTDYADWPLEPIDLVDGIPFRIATGYILSGVPESAKAYLDYCMANCDWNTTRFEERDAAWTNSALAKVIGSSKWKNPLSPAEREFFSAQIR